MEPVELDGAAILGTELVPLTRSDRLTVGDLCTGVAVFGATGSGKTTGSGQQLALGLLAAGFGGLVLAAKTEERELWERYARMTGRTRDLLFFSPSEGWRFNVLDYEWRRPGAGGGNVENIVRLFTIAMETLGAGEQKASGNNAYWQRAMQELLRNAVALVGMGTGHVTLEDINRLIATAPRSQAAVDAEVANPNGFCVQLLEAARNRYAGDPAKLADCRKVMDYWFGQWPHIPPETRGNILSTFTSATDAFGFSPFRELFCTDTNIAPDVTEYGKIIFIDLNIKEYGKTGQFAQVLFKTCFQNTVERRDLKASPMPVFLWGDEAPYFLNSEDESVLRTARSKRLISVYLMQNLTTLYEALGGQSGRDKAHSILANLGTKVFHANTCAESNKFAAELIGQSKHMMASFSEGTSGGTNWGMSSSPSEKPGAFFDAVSTSRGGQTGWNESKSASEQMHYDVQPKEFTLLRTGGLDNGLCVDAVVSRTGHIWSNGRNYLHVTFKQE